MSNELYDGPCEAGCISFHGGEKRHHKDCGYYPSSLTKLNADRLEELEARLATAIEEKDSAIRDVLQAIQRNTSDEWVKNLRLTHVKRMIGLMRKELKGETQ